MEWIREIATEATVEFVVNCLWKVVPILFAGGAIRLSLIANRNATLALENHRLQFKAVSSFRKLINIIGKHIIVRPLNFNAKNAKEAITSAIDELENGNDFSEFLTNTKFNKTWVYFKADLERLIELTGDVNTKNTNSKIKSLRRSLVSHSKFIFKTLMNNDEMTPSRSDSLHSVLTKIDSNSVFGESAYIR